MDTKKRIDFLDYIKAICVLMVIVTHYGWTSKETLFFYLVIKMAVPVFMIITGYNFAMSFQKGNYKKFSEMYCVKKILMRVKRFMIPFWIICIVEIVILIYRNKKINLGRIFLEGAYGPGSYYVPVLMQLILIFPVIYWVIKKTDWMGLLILGCVNFAYELFVSLFEMNPATYRMCIGRFVLFIALGCFLQVHSWHHLKWQILGGAFLFGFFYIVFMLSYGGKLILFAHWKGTAMPVSLYIFPIIVLCFKEFYDCHIPGVPGRILSYVGKSSYHIYLCQMVYYYFGLGGAIMNWKWYIAVPYNVLVCVFAGTLFYFVESKITCLIRSIATSGISLKHGEIM